MQQFQDLVETCGVGGTRGADREDLLQAVVALLVGAEDLGVQQRLAGPHPVLVTGDGVDLTVVCHAAERMGQRPGREGVGREARVHDAQRRLHPVVLQVQVERPQLRGGEHALVDEGLPGQAGEVDGLAADRALAGALLAELVLDPLAHHVGAALQSHPGELLGAAGGRGDEQLQEGRHRIARERTQGGFVDRHLAPAEHGEALFADDLLDAVTRTGRFTTCLGKECDTGGVRTFRRQLEIGSGFGQCGPEELVRELNEDACTVTGIGLRTRSTAVLQVQQCGDRLVDDVAAAAAVHIDDECDTTGVVFVRRVVQTDATGRTVSHSRLTRGARKLRHASAFKNRRLQRRGLRVVPSYERPCRIASV